MTTPSPFAPQPKPEQLSPCPVCGGEEYHWGKFEGESVLRFYTADGSRWDRKTRHGGDYIKARVCMNCGNVQLFVKPKREKVEGETESDVPEEKAEREQREQREESSPLDRPQPRPGPHRPVPPKNIKKGPARKPRPKRPLN